MFQKKLDEIFKIPVLKEAYKEINKNAIGLDDISFKEFRKYFTKNIENLLQELISGLYSPEPLKKIEIDKANSTEKRPIALSSLKDKIVQKVLYTHLNPYFDKIFSNKSYAYRPNKSTLKAINRVSEFIGQKNHFILKTDIANFFETINHDKLLQILDKHIADKRIIRLISLFIQTGGFKKYDYDEHFSGIHQGDILSPLLSNIYLNMMDKFLEKQHYNFVRYADDFVVLHVKRKALESLLPKLQTYLASFGLQLKDSKTSILHVSDGFTFLGVHFHGKNRQVDNERLQKSISKLHKLAKNSSGFAKYIKELNAYLYALKNYYLKIISKNSTQHRIMKNHLVDSIAHKVFLSKTKKDISTKKEFKIFISQIEFDLLFDYEQIKDTIELIITKGYEKYLASKSYKDTKAKINKKKNIYAKKFANNSTLHISKRGLMLGVSKNKFVIKEYGKVKHTYPQDKITRIIIEGSGFSLSTNVIKTCADNAITIDFITRDALSYASLITYKSSITQSIYKQSLILHTPLQINLASEFIRGKAKNQINYLKYLNKYHKLLDKNIDAMQKNLIKIKLASQIDEIMGYEGSISASYWDGLRLILETPFEKRITFGAKDIVNSSLNYAYAILYGKVQHSLVHAGLSLNISFLHALDTKKPTLTFDMIEEFRTFIVDRTVISMPRFTS